MGRTNMNASTHRHFVAIHQPNFLPWTGYFLKMALADTFVFHDSVHLHERGVTRRTSIYAPHLPTQKRWLTVPLQQHSHTIPVGDLIICHTTNWVRLHLDRIHNTYCHAPFYRETMPQIRAFYRDIQDISHLAVLNIHLISCIATYLGFNPLTVRSSSAPVHGTPSEVNRQWVARMGGSHYISGKGGTHYESDHMYEELGIKRVSTDALSFLENRLATPRCPGEAGLSVIDAWMHKGGQWIHDSVTAWKKQVLESPY